MFYLSISVLLFVLSFISGMLGLGVAFVAIPVLGLFGFELKHVIMPWALLLNGLTSVSGAIAYLRARMADMRTAIPLVIITTVGAPIGVWLLQFVSTGTIWWIYVAVLVFLAYRMSFPPEMEDSDEIRVTDRTRIKAGALGFLISIFAGFLGVGPGFLLMPTLILLGYTARIAAATNMIAVTLPSFSAFASHLSTARFDWTMLIATSIASIIGAQAGAIFMSRRVRSKTLSRIFAMALGVLALQRIYLLLAS